jgi:hypothetical protein
VFSPVVHRYIFLFGICILGGAMLFGMAPTSIPQAILVGNWLLEGNFKEKLRALKSNKIFWALTSVFFIHLLGLLTTTNLEAGLNDIRVKLPLVLFPLVFFSTKVIDKREFNLLLNLFIIGILINSFWCIYYYYSHTLIDLRKVSRFMSHIRFGLFINMGICTLVYFIRERKKTIYRIVFVMTIVYLLWFMLNFGLVTGIVLFSLISIAFVFYLIVKQNVKVKLIGFSTLMALLFAGFCFLNSEWKKNSFIDTSINNQPKEKSLSGRNYYPVGLNKQTENGFYLAYNIQYDEIYKVWPELSKKSILQSDERENPLIWTLLRYMTSKGLTKDSFGLSQLSKSDIENIENGITNYNYADASPLRIRVKGFMSEYQDYKSGANPSGNTMLMRFEFWKAAIYIIKRNVWLGVGTGDAQTAFNKAYYRTQTNLTPEWRLRSHNQFLAITVSFGIVGLIVFIFSIIYPIFVLRRKLDELYFAFIFIVIISFITEDTLESLTGASFFAYFNSLLLWLAYEKKEFSKSDNL